MATTTTKTRKTSATWPPAKARHEIGREQGPRRFVVRGHQAGYASTESPAPDEESAARAHFAQVLEIVAPHAKGVRFELVAIDAWILTVQDFSEDGDGELDVWHRRETVIARG